MLNVEVRHPAQRSLRLAVVTETYPPEVNGVAMTIARLVEGLRARNHSIQLVRPRQDKTETAGEADSDTGFHEVLMRGLPIPRYPHLKMGVPSKKALVELWSLRRPDLVHIVTEGPLGWSALQAAKRLKLPVTSDFRTNFHAYSQHYGVGWLHRPIVAYLRKLHNQTLCTFVPTEGLRQNLLAHGFENLKVAARGVDTTLFSPAKRSTALRRQWGATDATRVVLSVGRLAAEKNLATVVAAYEALQQTTPDSRLVVVGDGPERKALQARCPDAVFAGTQLGEALATHYASSDVFLFPSTTETFGNVTTEAMASGLAVLAYDYAAAAEYIRSGDNGLLAAFNHTADFVAQAALLAANAEQVHALGAQARQTALGLGWERIVEQVEHSMLAVLRSSAQPRPSALIEGNVESW